MLLRFGRSQLREAVVTWERDVSARRDLRFRIYGYGYVWLWGLGFRAYGVYGFGVLDLGLMGFMALWFRV